MEQERVYDLIYKGGNRMEVYNGHVLDKHCFCIVEGQELKLTKVKTAAGTTVILRYIWYPETEYINHTAEPYEKYIDEHYERI